MRCFLGLEQLRAEFVQNKSQQQTYKLVKVRAFKILNWSLEMSPLLIKCISHILSRIETNWSIIS